jgi:hypothetical protein
MNTLRAVGLVAISLASCASSTECAGDVERLRQAASDVWLSSQDDRPLTIDAFPSEVAGPEGPTDIAARVGLTARGWVEVRDARDFFATLEPSPGNPRRDAPQSLRDEITSLLVDTAYFGVHEAPASVESVRVIFTGRTACGDRVWIESVSVESAPMP